MNIKQVLVFFCGFYKAVLKLLKLLLHWCIFKNWAYISVHWWS